MTKLIYTSKNHEVVISYKDQGKKSINGGLITITVDDRDVGNFELAFLYDFIIKSIIKDSSTSAIIQRRKEDITLGLSRFIKGDSK